MVVGLLLWLGLVFICVVFGFGVLIVCYYDDFGCACGCLLLDGVCLWFILAIS